ncbi:MAG: PepSY domain-containing protein [Planctomycetota bacterium]
MKTTNGWNAMVGLTLLGFVSLARADEPGLLAQIQKAVATAQIRLTEAIETAQKEVPDGQVLEAELQWDEGPICYGVGLLSGDRVKELKIDAVSGKVLGVENQEMDEADTQELAEAKQALTVAKMTLAEAIKTAELETKGRAFGIQVKAADVKMFYEVTLLRGDKVVQAMVDGVGGKVLDVKEEPIPLAYWMFDKDKVGKTPPGLSLRETRPSGQPGTWKIAADPTAPSKPNVLSLTTAAPDATFNLALVDKPSFKDLDLRVRIKPDSGKEDQGGGLIWRCKDENNYYVCRINPLEGNYRVYKVVDGKRQQLQSASVQTFAGMWYQLQVTMVGDRITCYLDGIKQLEAKDDTFKDAGMIGLWTKADASCSFDNLAVYPAVAGALTQRWHDPTPVATALPKESRQAPPSAGDVGLPCCC